MITARRARALARSAAARRAPSPSPPPPRTRASGATSASRWTTARSFIAMDAPPEREDCRPFVHVARAAARGGRARARRSSRRTSRRASCCSPTSARRTYLQALERRRTPTRLFADAIDALVTLAAREPRPACCRPTTRRCCGASSSSFPSGTSRGISGMTLSARSATALEGDLRSCSSHSALAQPRGLRAPRLHAAQPHGERAQSRRARFPGRGATARSPTTSVSLLRDAFVSWDEERVLDWTRALLGEGEAGGPAGRRRLRRVLARLRVDGAAAPPQGARHLRAHPLPRRQAGLPRRHAALPRATRARSPARYARAGAARARAARTSCTRHEGDDPRGRPRRALRPLTDAMPKPLLEAGGKPLIAWHLERLAARGLPRRRDQRLAPRRAHRRARSATARATALRIAYSRERERARDRGRHRERAAAARRRRRSCW